jgi:hypothetical protein
MDGRQIHFAIKIHFEGQRRSVKHRAASITAAQVALDFTCHIWREAPFQILTNQPNCGLTWHPHNGPPQEWALGPAYCKHEAKGKVAANTLVTYR